jgi:hypothetical protein
MTKGSAKRSAMNSAMNPVKGMAEFREGSTASS